MADKIQWAGNTMPKSDDKHLGIMSLDHVKKARAFHQSFPQYTVTPLARLDGQAARLGLSNLCVKDESYRFGLNAFKVLGGSFAMANYIADETGKDVAECTFDYLTSDQLAKDFGQATFFTATDGNHGRGVAWAANKLGQKAVVHMPKGSTKPRFDNIAAEGATVTIEEVNYDECVRMAAAEADACERGVIVQDTAWEGYEKIPSWIMEGYGTMLPRLPSSCARWPSTARRTCLSRLAWVRSRAPWWATSPTCIPITRPPSLWSSALRPPACTRVLPPATAIRASWTATCLHHGRPVLRRAQHLGLGYPASTTPLLRVLPRLGHRSRHAHPGCSREGRPARHLRRVRRCDHRPGRDSHA